MPDQRLTQTSDAHPKRRFRLFRLIWFYDHGVILMHQRRAPVTDTDITLPTAERMRIAKTPAVVIGGKIVKAANDNFVIDKVTGGMRMQDSPLDRLLRTGAITAMQHEAGARYFADYFAAGLAPLGAFDYSRPVVDGASPKGESDYRLGALQRWNGSRQSLGTFFAAVVDPVVLHEQTLESAGRALGYNNRPQAVAVAMDRIVAGLQVLVAGYGLETKKAT